MKLLFEKHVPGSNFFRFPLQDLPEIDLQETLPEEHWRETETGLPELSEVEAIRHFTEAAKRTFGVDDGTCPIGGRSIRHSPKLGEYAARLGGFARVHPRQPVESVQGAMELLFEFAAALAAIGGMNAVSLQPASGDCGVFAGLAIVRAYHKSRGQNLRRRVVLIPETARDANFETAAAVGYDVRVVKANADGRIDLGDFYDQMDDDVAAVTFANPNALGIFESDVLEITEAARELGALAFYDGANLNAIAGVARPGDMGFDLASYDLQKTFAAPCGGSGAGAIGVKSFLEPFLPTPLIVKSCDGCYEFDCDRPKSIGKVQTFYGNFGVCVRAYAYVLSLGCEGLKRACQRAASHANYVRTRLADDYDFPFDGACKHEFVCVPKKLDGVSDAPRALDVAKRLIDFGYYPPTVRSFPNVDEALLIEPTETETKERLDDFIAAMKRIARERAESPEPLFEAPRDAPVKRVDETRIALEPVVKYEAPNAK